MSRKETRVGRTEAGPIAPPPEKELHEAVLRALDEDLGPGGRTGDPTSTGLRGHTGRARLVARQAGTIAGLAAVRHTLDAAAGRLDTGPVRVALLTEDGETVTAGTVLAGLDGDTATLLGAERTFLNLVGHLSGIATATAALVATVAGTGVVVRDTRKTVPGLRTLAKYAVRCGGGTNHRTGLFDALLVKDNHVRAAGGLTAAVTTAREAAPDLPLEVEVDTLDQVREALTAHCDLILLDNMDLDTMRAAVALARGKARLEASGGITAERIRAVAQTGVDMIAVGAITHSAPALDVALDWD